MKIAINAASAQMGGAVTYLQSVVPLLHQKIVANGSGKIVLWARPGTPLAGVEQRDPGAAMDGAGVRGIARRLWFDQLDLPRRIRQDRIDALFSSANFGTLRSPVRQVLLVRNTLYFDPVFLDRISSRSLRAKYLAQRVLVLRSIDAADVVLYPSLAMRDLVAARTSGVRSNWQVAPYGARLDLFTPAVERPGADSERPWTVLHVSHYSDQKNLGTLFSAMHQLNAGANRAFRLLVTAGLGGIPTGPGYPNIDREREAFRVLQRANLAEDIGAQPYSALPAVYRAADVFVFPSYTESFGHPLLEAMATGLPIVAADTAINREVCDDAAIYFKTFDGDACADAIARVINDRGLAAKLGMAGIRRSRLYTWDRHVEVLWDALAGR